MTGLKFLLRLGSALLVGVVLVAFLLGLSIPTAWGQSLEGKPLKEEIEEKLKEMLEKLLSKEEAEKQRDEEMQRGETAEQRGQLREALKHYIAAFQAPATSEGSSVDERLRERIIKLVQRLDPPPAIPERAERYMGRGQAAFKLAQSEGDYEQAIQEFQKALRLAPWWANAYFNLGTVQEKAWQYEAAIQSLRLYLLAAPHAPDAGQVRAKLGELEFKQERVAKLKRHAAKSSNTPSYGVEAFVNYGTFVIDGREVRNVFTVEGRVIAIAITTNKLNAQTNELEDEILIHDITNRSDTFSRSLWDWKRGTIPVDDRTPGQPRYTTELVPKGDDTLIVFYPEYRSGSGFTVSVNDLYKMRALHAISLGDTLNLGGQRFYTLPQTGALHLRPGGPRLGVAALALIPDNVVYKMVDPNFNPMNLRPQFVAYTKYVTPSGDKGWEKTPLGKVRGKWYWLVLDRNKDMYTPTEGEPPARPLPSLEE